MVAPKRRRRDLLAIERELWERGLERVAGVDEAGLGPLAGPVVAAAVILPPGLRIDGVADSKALDAETRERLEPEIRTAAVAWAIAVVEPAEIDARNVYRAGLVAMRRAVSGLDPAPEHVLVDGRARPELDVPHDVHVKGDARVHGIAAASILAKVERDRLMSALDAVHPGYGFARHKGYATPDHLEALARLGACAAHRRSFSPVAEAAGLFGELYARLAAELEAARTELDLDRAEMRYVGARRELSPAERRQLEKRLTRRRRESAAGGSGSEE